MLYYFSIFHELGIQYWKMTLKDINYMHNEFVLLSLTHNVLTI